MVDVITNSISVCSQIFNSGPANNVKLILIPSPTTSSFNPEVFAASPDQDIHAPLDLSCKSGHDLLRRSSSSSSASSTDSGFLSGDFANFQSGIGANEEGGDDKKLKRREQNKAAAQAYRQRKKSISDLVETEYDLLLKHNVDLLGKKAKLEGQISRMRQLLDHVIQVSKRQQEQEQEQRRVATEFLRSKSVCETGAVGVGIGFVDEETYHSDADRKNVSVAGRSRQYSWPSDGSTSLSSKTRKKEQNRIASQKFRERRRRALSRCQEEADFYQCTNVLLKKRCQDLESKIQVLKEFLQSRAIPVTGMPN